MNWEAERANLQSDSTNRVLFSIHILFGGHHQDVVFVEKWN